MDGIRGLAVLSVIAFHLFGFKSGWAGVDLFFVLSGFLITSILIDTKNGKDFFKKFYIKRVLRIFPLYYAVLIVFFGLFLFSSEPGVLKKAIPYFGYYQNIDFSFNGWPDNFLTALNHFWSLAVEEQFYLFFPLLIYFAGTARLPVIFIALIGISILTRFFFFYELKNTTGCYIFTLCRLDSLLCGGFASIYARNKKNVNVYLLLLMLFIFIFFSIKDPGFSSEYFSTAGFTLNAVLFSMILLVSLSTNNSISAFFCMPLLRHFGKLAYGLYIYHHIAFIFLNYFFSKKHFFSSALTTGLIVFACSYISAYLSYRFFEAPILKLKYRFIKERAV